MRFLQASKKHIMDPVIDNEWLGIKNEPIDEAPNVGSVVRSWQWREHGLDPPHSPNNKTVLENIAEDILVQKPLTIRSCDLPGYPRSTFLMVFSPDGTKVASTHGNHNVYVSELASGKHVRILKGHPRTPWCIAFHPSHPQLIGSGCLGGQVRVWDISSSNIRQNIKKQWYTYTHTHLFAMDHIHYSTETMIDNDKNVKGGSEVWNVRNETVIASIAFHPREQLLVIATYNELYFWDWSQPAPFTRVSTNNVNEKVRYVAFDALGYKLITGISLWTSGSANNVTTSLLQHGPPTVMLSRTNRDDPSDGPSRPQENPGTAQDMIVNSYQNLVQRYDSLVRNYQRLFMVRHRLTNTPPPPNTIDRGTDPMETDLSSSPWTRQARPSTSTANDDEQSVPGTSRRQDSADSGEGESSGSRLLNLDVLSIDGNPRNQNNPDSPQQEHSIFGSRSSAFQPLTDSTGRSFRTIDQNERTTRLLPNPFSSTSGISRSSRVNFSDLSSSNANASRTSIFTATSFANIAQRRRQHIAHMASALQSESASTSSDASSTPSWPRFSSTRPDTPPNAPSTESTTTERPTMTNSSTQMSPTSAPVDAQAINESLDLIRDILRDSGTRLLNLITNMSLSTLASVERSGPRRRTGSGARSDDSEGGNRPRPRPRIRLFSSSLRRDLLSTSSDSDSDDSIDVNIFRRRTSFRVTSPNSRLLTRSQSTTPAATTAESESATPTREQENTQPESRPSTSTADLNANRPSTSRDNFWTRGCVVPPDEAYRKVRSGVHALQKHALLLTNMWLRGNRTTMRELRTMWENLRRRILTLHRETGRQDLPSYYTRSLLERCMFLSEMSDNISRSSSRTARHNVRNDESSRNQPESRDIPSSSGTTSNSNVTRSNVNTSTETTSREPRPRRSPQTRPPPSVRASPSIRRRLQSSYRWRPEDEIRRRSRNPVTNRLSHRYPHNRSRRDFARAIEISATRHEIRMRAMQVLSVMFNMMMMCLEERGLSQLIITMLRTLKRALALTCLMLMTNRNIARSGNNPGASGARVDSSNVVRIQNAEHSGPVDVDVDGPDEVMLLNNATLLGEPEPGAVPIQKINNDARSTERERTRTSQSVGTGDSPIQGESPPSISSAQKWSNRLAVQISAANRNNSATARNRRELYLESRRLKALHRTNPGAHPMVKKRVPPISHHRIPAVRFVPTRDSGLNSSRNVPAADEPVAGPSNASPSAENSRQDSPRTIDEFEQRVHLIRLAHMQAVRLRTAARNRFRRLQTIRLYTPSSVREMFALQSNNSENQQPGNRSPMQSGSEFGRGRPFAAYRPHILGPRNDQDRGEETSQVAGVVEVQPMHVNVNNVAVPLMQVNDFTVNEAPSQPHRMPRIHEYLQPIILAQNAMAVDEDNGGGGGVGGGSGGARRLSGMAGLLDAGIISEAMPAPAHRVQAWDFTTGDTPDIADSTKNVVVQRCRIHNDASIDISKDGRLLVALLPVPRLRNTNHWLGVYSLEWSRLGQCLHTAVLEQSAVSVALSPTARHLAVGLGSRRFTTLPNARNNVFAVLYRLEPRESSSRTGLSPIKELEQNWEQGFTSLNCLRWAPQPGQGLVYANNTGQLIIMS